MQNAKGQSGASQEFSRSIDAFELEARVLYSASPLPVEMFVAEAPADLQAAAEAVEVDWSVADDSAVIFPAQAIDESMEEEFVSISSLVEQSDPVSELIFIDTDVDQYQAMVEDLQQQYADSPHIQVVLLHSGDGVQQISDTLAKHHNLQAVHIVSHGSGRGVDLGDVLLTGQNLNQYASQIASWNDALHVDADILFYGCDLGSTDSGLELIESIAELTGADVAASEDLTGHESLGGDWNLEVNLGEITAEVVVSEEFQAAWMFVLAPPVIDMPAGPVDYYIGDPPTTIDATATITDLDSPDFDNGYLQVSFAANGTANDQLTIDFGGNFSTTGPNLRYSGTIIGSIVSNGSNGSDLRIDFDNDATPAIVQELLRNIQYSNSSATPSLAARVIEVVVNDGGGDSNIATETINVLDPAPQIDLDADDSNATGADYLTTFQDGGNPVRIVDLDFSYVDLDSTNWQTLTVDILGNPADRPNEIIGFDLTGTGISVGSWNANNGRLILTGDRPISEYLQVLQTLTYENTSVTDNSPRVIEISVVDAEGNVSNVAQSTVYIQQTNELWLTTTGDVPFGQGVTELGQWDNEDILSLANPTFEPGISGGTLSRVLDLEATGGFTGDVNAIHYVSRSINVAGQQLEYGDILMSVKNPSIIGGLSVFKADLFYYDASAGDFKMLIADMSDTSDITAISLIEQTTFVGDTLLNAGDLIYSVGSPGANKNDIMFYDVSIGSRTVLIDGDDLDVGISGDVDGLDLVESDFTMGGVNFQSGQIIVTLDDDDTYFGEDIFLLTPTGTEFTGAGNSAATHTLLFEGHDKQLDSPAILGDPEFINGLTFFSSEGAAVVIPVNAAPVLGSNQLTITEGQTVTLDGANFSATDVDNPDPSLTFRVSNLTGGHFALAIDTVTPITAFTQAQITAGDIVFVDDGDETAPSYDVLVDDADLADGPYTGTINFTNVNDTPDITSDGGAATANISAAENQTAVTDVDAFDPDLPVDTLTYNITGGADQLLFNIDTVSGVLTFISAPDFENRTDANTDGIYEVEVTVDDGNLATDVQTLFVTVTDANDTPVLDNIETTTITYIENDPPTQITNTITISDIDDGNIESATIEIMGNYANGQDVLAFTNSANITGSWDASTGTLTLTGTDTLAAYEAALQSVTYENTSDGPSLLTRTVTFTVNDGDDDAVKISRDIDITPVNDAPVITVNPAPLTYASGALAIDPLLNVSDADDAFLESAVVDFGAGYLIGEDTLVFVDQLGITGSFNPTTGTLTLTGTATVADYQTALRTVQYEDVNASPTVGTLQVSITVNDGSLDSLVAQRTIQIIDEEPPRAGNDSDTVAENGSVIIDLAGNDSDNNNTLDLSSIVIISGPADGTLVDNNDGTVTYTHNGAENATDSFVYTIKDDVGLESNQATVSLAVNPVNDAPVATIVASSYGVNEDDVPRLLGGISVSDADAGSGNLEVTVSVNDGSITLTTMTGLTITGGANGSSSLIVRGNLTDLNNALATLRYQPDPNFNGTDVLTLHVDDLGNSGAGVPLSHQDTANIVVAPVNDDPVITGPVTDGASEDDSAFAVNLLNGATDPEGDTLNVSGLNLDSGNATGITVVGNTLNVDPAAYNYLSLGQSEVIAYSYDIIDGNGGSVSQSATITITGVNDDPNVGLPISGGATEDNAIFNVDLLTGSSDPDSLDTINVSNLMLTGGSDAGVTILGNNLSIDPSAYNYLSVGQSETIAYSYDIDDGNGGLVGQTATITIVGVNDDPNVGPAIIAGAIEDAPTFNVDLLAGSSDPDTSDTINVNNLNLTSGNAAGVSVVGNSLSVDPAAYNYLAVGESEVISYSYDVDDGNGGLVPQTATIMITGVNDDPVVGPAITAGANEDDPTFNVNLLAGSSDPDTSDTINVSNLNLTGGNAAGVSVVGNSLSVDPSAYNYLAVGESEVITYTYDVDDSNGGLVAQTATVTITGVNDDPNVGPAIIAGANEDAPTFNVDLLAGSSDPDTSDTINVSNLNLTGGNAAGVSVVGNSLSVDPSAYNYLAVSESEVITYSYDVDDGNGGLVGQTATITITGVNDDPNVGPAITAGATEDAPTFNVDLLAGSSDPDTSDTINVSNLNLTGGNAAGVSVVGNSLSVDPSAYNYLAVGESEVITYTYDVDDGNGGLVAQTATITITGVNDDPNVGPAITAGANEDAPTFNVDLLAGSSDPDTNDTINVNNLNLTGGNAAGVSVVGNSLSVDPSAYNYLAVGESEVITYGYDVDDGNGGLVAQTATITITGVNDDPTVSAGVSASANESDPSFVVDLLTNAADPDTSDTINISGLTLVSGNPGGITVGVPTANDLTVDPAFYSYLAVGASEVIVYDYVVEDGNGGNVNQTVTITINGENEDPLISGPVTDGAGEDDLVFNVDLLSGASDPNGDTLNVINLVLTGGNASGVTLLGNSLDVDPNAYNSLAVGEIETITYTYDIIDGNGGSVAQTATITITGVNDAPTITSAVTGGSSEDDPGFVVDLLNFASDPDFSDSLNVTALSLTGGNAAGISAAGNSLNVDPLAYNDLAVGETEVISYSYTIVDGNGGSVDQTATITITGVNDAPVVGPPVTGGATEDDAIFNVDLLDGSSDPDTSDSINVNNLVLTGGNAAGVTILGNSLDVDPTAYNYLAAGESEVITYTYDVDDGNGGLTAQTATITISGVNDDPTVGGPVTGGGTEDDPGFVVDLLSGANDDDLSDVLAVTNLTLLSGDASGVSVGATDLTVDPSAYNSLALGETETITYTYDLDDGNGGVVPQTATITITGLNDAPIAADDPGIGVMEDTPRTFDALINDFDPDTNDTLSVSIVLGMGPSNGSVVINPDNTFTYTPNLNYNGPDSFTYEISDGNGGVDQATVTINVTPINDPPTVDNPVGTVTVDEDDPDTVLDLTSVFGDVDDAVLTYNVLGNSNGGLVTDTLIGNTLTLGYVADQFGSATIVVQAMDSAGQTITDTITVIVNPVNDAPTVVSAVLPIVVNEDAGDTLINLTTVFGDIDDATLTYSIVSNDNGSLVASTVAGNNLRLDYQDNQSGAANVTVRAVDSGGLVATHTVQVDVDPVNDAPVVINHDYDVDQDGSISGNVLAGSTDIENDSLTVSLLGGPSSGTLVLNPNGTFTFTPAEGFFGAVSFQFQASDGADVSNIATATIKVESGPYTPPGTIDPDTDPDTDPDPDSELPPGTGGKEGTVEEAPRVIEVRQSENFTPLETAEPDAVKTNSRVKFAETPLQYFEYRVQQLNTKLTESEASRYIAAIDVSSPLIFASLDNFSEDLDEVVDNLGVALVGSLVSLSGVSIGVVSWILRSSALVTSLMANMPAWRLIDPLVVLGYDDVEESGESVEDIIDAGPKGQSQSPSLKTLIPSQG